MKSILCWDRPCAVALQENYKKVQFVKSKLPWWIKVVLGWLLVFHTWYQDLYATVDVSLHTT